MKKVYTRNNILRLGLVLLIMLIATMFLIGRMIVRTGQKMNRNMGDERSLVSLQNLRTEFNGTVSLVGISAGLLENSSQNSEEAFAKTAQSIFRFDPKVGRVWFAAGESDEIIYYDRQSPACYRASADKNQITIREALRQRSQFDTLFFEDTAFVWSIAARSENPRNRFIMCAEINSEQLFEFMAQQDSRSYRSSYLYIYSADGVVLFSPDSVSIGKKEDDSVKTESIRRVVQERTTVRSSIQDDFLSMPAERFFYPLNVGAQQWVVAVTVLHISFEDTVAEFDKYAVVITAVSITLFIALLVFSQLRLQREHKRRLEAEKLSAKLRMDRLFEHLQPHFLFNSLNSLYSLIKKDPERARQFVLKLAGMYRYLLEQRNDPLSAVAKEVEILEQYIFLQTTRLGDQIIVTVDVDESAYGMLIPSMSLQSLVENAIKHNAFTLENPLAIRVYSTEDAIVVENDVTQTRADASYGSTGLGFESIKAIYKYYSDKKASFRRIGGVFRCVLPMLKNNNSPLR